MMQFMIAFDQLVNTIFGGFADETLSARCWRMNKKHRHKGKWRLFRVSIDALFFWQTKYHCCYAYRSEIMRRQCPTDYRNIGKK